MFKEWDRVVVNEPDMGIVSAKGTIIHVTKYDDGQVCGVRLDDEVKGWPGHVRYFIDNELTIITNKEQAA